MAGRKGNKTEEDALQNYIDRYGSFVNHLSDEFALLEIVPDKQGNPADYLILDTSPGFRSMIGLAEGPLPGLRSTDLFARAGLDWSEEYHRAAVSGETSRFEFYSFSRDRYYEAKAFALSSEIIISLFCDISDGKKEELAIKEKIGEVEQVFENMINAFVIWDSVFDDSGKYVSFRFGFFNESYSRIAGLEYEDVKGKDVFEVWPETEQEWVDVYSSVALTGIPKTFEMYHAPTAGWYICNAYRPTSSPDRVCVIFDDITGRKETELALYEERNRLAVTLRSIADGVITTDLSGNVVLINSAAEQMTGWNVQDARGIPLNRVLNIVDEEKGSPCRELIEDVLETGSVFVADDKCELVPKNGGSLKISYSGALIHNSEDDAIGTVIVFRDITEKSRLNELTRKTQKLESLEILAGGIAHDFNNFLGGVFGFIELALERSTDRKVKEYLTESLSNIDRARSFTRQLLSFTKGGLQEKKVEALFPFVKDTVLFALSGSSVKCRFRVEDNLWHCEFDRNQLAQVFENLAINALQAMPEGGVLEVGASNVGIGDEESISLCPGNYVEVSLRDQGPGISRENQRRIFEPYFTTKPSGHGLGLFSCYSIISHHGGIIDLDSEPGKGSDFKVYLPAYSERTKGEEIPAASRLHRGSGTFFIMDDKDFIRKILKEILETFGYDVIEAEEGRELLEIFRYELSRGTRVAGMIFDLTIPGSMGGKDALDEIRKLSSDIPLFIASGYSNDPVITDPGKYGFCDSLCKPFGKNELSEMLEKHIRPLPPAEGESR